MTPDEQYAQSVKYVPAPLTIIPVSGGFGVFVARGSQRDFLGVHSLADLPALFASHYAEATTARERQLRLEAARQLPPDLDLSDFSL